MAMWAIMGVGMLINTLQQASQNSGMRSDLEAQQAQLAKTLKDNAGFSVIKRDPVMTQRYDWNFEAPPFPDKSYKNLQDMQFGHTQERGEFTQKLQAELNDMKDQFFGNNHYQTENGPDGKPQVAMGSDGKPVVQEGGESSDQRLTRLQFENTQKTELADKQADQKDHFMSSERQNVKDFLAENQQQLGNPYVQGELQKMVVDTKKKALQLQQSQEDERWKVDLPPDTQIQSKVDTGLQQLRQMDQQHMAAEEESPDMQALLEHDQQVAAVLGEQRDLAKQQKSNDDFLKDPRKMMAAAQAPPQPRDVGDVLPGYLTHTLYDMGIYTV